MENYIETNFREIQKILDSCIAHDYKTKVDELFLNVFANVRFIL